MLPTLEPWVKFEIVVKRILKFHGFSLSDHSIRGERGYDLIGENTEFKWAIEVKYYRTARARPSLIEAAAARVSRNGNLIDNRRGC